ncbi:MAG TPA: TetR/AcrR family transcriptional regulator [Vicinamibacteria bacterium]|nr:TetR/AcrR family transcriptional regulator [Vicinamibacteria bacterium]
MKVLRKPSSSRLRLPSNAPRPRRSPGAKRPGSGVAKESERRKDIIDRAAPILIREGYKGISMNELARQLHLTKPGLYYHFKDKQELLYASMHRSMDFIEKMSLQATMGARDNEERLREIIYQHALRVAVSERKGALTTLIVDDVSFLRSEDRRVITQRKRAYFELVRATVIQLKKEGRLRKDLDAVVATFTILGMVMWLTKWYEPSGRLNAEEVAGQIADMALAALVTDGA